MGSRHPLTLPERAAARLLTGPVGHLVAGAIDWVVLLSRYWWARIRGQQLG